MNLRASRPVLVGNTSRLVSEGGFAVLRSAGLWRAVLHRSRADWPVVLAASLLLVCATTLLAAGALYGDVVALGGLRRAVLDASAAQRTVLVRSTTPVAQLAAVDHTVRGAITDALGSGTGEIGLVAQTGSYTPSAATGSGGGSGDAADLTRLGAYPAIADHAAL